MKINHVSFDLWKTLITPNKEFKPARIEVIHQYLKGEFSIEEVTDAISKLSSLGDCYGEFFEQGFTSTQLYYLLLYQLYGKNTNKFIQDYFNLQGFISEINALHLQYCPYLISDEVYDILDYLKSKNITCNIASNTSLASGALLRKFLKHHKIFHYFDFMLFSDELGVFKPNRLFFQQILDLTGKSRPEILHVGDNILTDVKGAEDFGFKTLLFSPTTPNYSTIKLFI
jgi:putative hydrolase of the HAD superfamily